MPEMFLPVGDRNQLPECELRSPMELCAHWESLETTLEYVVKSANEAQKTQDAMFQALMYLEQQVNKTNEGLQRRDRKFEVSRFDSLSVYLWECF